MNLRKAATSYKSPTKRILTKTFTARYLIGGVPVWQVTTFTLDAKVTASAEGEVHAGANATESASISLGALFNNDNWSTFSSPITLEPSITANLGVKGKVNAEVRLIPNIEIRFYESIGGNLSVEPYLGGEIKAESVLFADIINELFPGFITQMTDFDINLGLECFVNADLDVIVSTILILDKTKICGPIERSLFSLPEFTVTSERSGKEVVAHAKVVNGTNNQFDTGSIEWFIEPEGPTLNISGKTMSFTPESGVDNYLIFFSGHGKLGPVSRQFASASDWVDPLPILVVLG